MKQPLSGHVDKNVLKSEIKEWMEWLVSGISNLIKDNVLGRAGTICFSPDSILSQYLGADLICISIVQVLRFYIPIYCDF